MTMQDAQSFTVKVNVGVSYIKGTAEVATVLAARAAGKEECSEAN